MIPPNLKDRFLDAIRAIIQQETPGLAYAGIWEYEVTSANGQESVNGTPVDSAIPLPALNNVPMASLACGGVSEPTVGTRFLVEFKNENGARYVVVGCDPAVKVATLDATDTVYVGSTLALLGPATPARPASPGVPPGPTSLSAVVVNCQAGAGGVVLVTSAAPHMFTTGDTICITGVVGTTEANTMAPCTVVDALNFSLDGTVFANAYTSGGVAFDASYVPDPGMPAQPASPASPPSTQVARNGDGMTVWMPAGLLNGLLDIGGGTKLVIKNMPLQILTPLPGLITGGNLSVRA